MAASDEFVISRSITFRSLRASAASSFIRSIVPPAFNGLCKPDAIVASSINSISEPESSVPFSSNGVEMSGVLTTSAKYCVCDEEADDKSDPIEEPTDERTSIKPTLVDMLCDMLWDFLWPLMTRLASGLSSWIERLLPTTCSDTFDTARTGEV